MAGTTASVTDILSTLTDALTSAKDAFPENEQAFVPPKEGISLLDVKNDLLLSYLQHLVYLILLRIRTYQTPAVGDSQPSDIEVIHKLIELRAYLERGVRPLEGKLRYQIDKVLRAADDAHRAATQTTQKTHGVSKKSKTRKPGNDDDSDISISGSGDDDSDASEMDTAADSDDEEAAARPNPAALTASLRDAQKASQTREQQRSSTNGIYKPPRINAVAMPTDRSKALTSDDTVRQRRRKNALLDEYVAEVHSTAPAAQPSIGSNNTILARGRSGFTDRDRDRERERTEYEERNFTRLPGISKAEKKKERARTQREARDIFGGEDWSGLGGLGERVSKSVAGGSGLGKLERREKRRRETVDGPRGDGVGMGETFEKRRKVLKGREDRKRTRR